jgi:hypothetical protein
MEELHYYHEGVEGEIRRFVDDASTYVGLVVMDRTARPRLFGWFLRVFVTFIIALILRMPRWQPL